MSDKPSELEMLHMALVVLGLVSAGVTVRDLNRKNWGLRAPDSSGNREVVMLDGAGFELGPRPVNFPLRVKVSFWWHWLEESQPTATEWLRGSVVALHAE